MTPPPDWPVPLIPASDAERRKAFNEAGYYDDLRRGGSVTAVMIRDRPAPPTSGQPDGTRSQTLVYYRDGVPVALVFQYLLPSGGIGASGLPDPKVVITPDGRGLKRGA